jgi:hypothetical protein
MLACTPYNGHRIVLVEALARPPHASSTTVPAASICHDRTSVTAATDLTRTFKSSASTPIKLGSTDPRLLLTCEQV